MNYFSSNKVKNHGITALVVLNSIAIVVLVIMVIKPHRPKQHLGPKNRLVKELNLTDEQTANYEMLIEVHQTKMKELRDKIHMAKQDYFGELEGQRNNAALAKIGRLQTEIESNTLQHFIDFKALLTDEQKKKFETIYLDVLASMAGPIPGAAGHRPPPPMH
ncbi:MAG: periplasmic heavy metal sensor [Bacteroidetes bacterium]|nr:periplasmic heavy metal sensor [Bacteroidota bacterium]